MTVERDLSLIDNSKSRDANDNLDPLVYQLDVADESAWTHFLAEHSQANLYHTIVWRDLLVDVFCHKPFYLLCEHDGKISGVLPLFLIKLPILGKKLISIPYDIGNGGALAVNEIAERALVKKAIDLAKEKRVNYLELRYGSHSHAITGLGLQKSEPVIITEMELSTEKDVWAKVSKDHKKSIRKAQNRGIKVREANTLEDFHAFNKIILQVFRSFGTPPYGSNYFPALWHKLYNSGAVRLLLAFNEQRCVGGLLLFCWGQNLVSKFSACLPEAVPARAYVALYWHAIHLGLEAGYRKLSWGTSSRDQKGLIDFKERWGAQSRPAVFYSFSVKGEVPSIEKYYDSEGLVRRLWRLQPLWTTQYLGGWLSRWFC